MKFRDILNEKISPIIYTGQRPNIKKFDIRTNPEWRVGVWATNNIDVAKGFGSHIYEIKVNFKNPFVVNGRGSSYYSIKTPKELKDSGYTQLKTVDTDIIAEWAIQNGYDGVIFKNIVEGNVRLLGTTYVMFNNNIITMVKNYPKNKVTYEI